MKRGPRCRHCGGRIKTMFPASFPSCFRSPKDHEDSELLPNNMGTREPVILNVYDMVSRLKIEQKASLSFCSRRSFKFNVNLSH